MHLIYFSLKVENKIKTNEFNFQPRFTSSVLINDLKNHIAIIILQHFTQWLRFSFGVLSDLKKHLIQIYFVSTILVYTSAFV